MRTAELVNCLHLFICVFVCFKYVVMSSGQFRGLVRKYGVTAIGTYFTISAATFWGLYFAIENKFDVKGTLQVPSVIFTISFNSPSVVSQKWSLLPSQTQESEEQLAANTRWYKRLVSEGKGSSIALAFLCTKALVPVKIPVAMSLTPIVHRCLRSIGLIKLQTVIKNR